MEKDLNIKCSNCVYYERLKQWSVCNFPGPCYSMYSQYVRKEPKVIKSNIKRDLHSEIRPYCNKISELLKELGCEKCTKVLIDREGFVTFNTIEEK